MTIVPYKLKVTQDQFTSRAGLLSIAELMEKMKLATRIDRYFAQPQSNRGFKPSIFIQTLILMQHEGSFRLDDVRHISEDRALRTLLGLKTIPTAKALGVWLRRMGAEKEILSAWQAVNKGLLKAALHKRKGITLDIDATEITANKSDAKWTYKKNKGYMPMVGHIAETGQVVACDFRAGNAAPAKENLEFIQQCQASLPDPCFVKALRIDSAGYQEEIIKYCDDNEIKYTIRAKMCDVIKQQIDELTELDWQPMLNKQGKTIKNQNTYRTIHCIGNYERPFTLIIQRKQVSGQVELDLDCTIPVGAEEIKAHDYIYRAIATNQDDLSNSDIVHWYNQRAEDSENRIKELKLDFGGDTLPCSDFKANTLYFLVSALSYNLFALMKQLLPEELAHHRAKTIRWRLYGIAAKVVKTARQLFVKLRAQHKDLLALVVNALRRIEPPPI